MTAEIFLVILLVVAAALAIGLGALILAAFGPAGLLLALAVLVTAAWVWRMAAAPAARRGDDLQDDWRADGTGGDLLNGGVGVDTSINANGVIRVAGVRLAKGGRFALRAISTPRQA